jgi:hypothetical protein
MNKFYLARFIENDMKHQALFTKNGYLKYDISYGREQQLPEKQSVTGSKVPGKIIGLPMLPT